MLANLFKRLPAFAQPVDAPLLNRQELLDLQNRAENMFNTRPYEKEVAHRQYGDARSVYRGYGLDYEESRPYQAGDEMRFMNWRLSARSNELYMKVFREERRPSVFILVDRRAGMRFGSRKRLKVSQAARVAAYISYLARQQNAPVAGVLLEDTPAWIPEQAGDTGIYNFINSLVTPCPPVASDNCEPLEHYIRLLTGMLAKGSVVYLLSDFHDLAETARPGLLQLCTEHSVHAISIVDRNERNLPKLGGTSFMTPGHSDAIHLDSSDATTLHEYERLANEHYARIAALLGLPGISYSCINADQDDIEQQVPLP